MDFAKIRLDWKQNWIVYVFSSLLLPGIMIGISQFYRTTFVDNFGGPMNLMLFYLLTMTVVLILKYIGNGWIRVWPNSR